MLRVDKLTKRARNVLSIAQEVAWRFTHDSIRDERLLLGLVREGDGVAGKALSNLQVELDKVQYSQVHHRAVTSGLTRSSGKSVCESRSFCCYARKP